MKKYTVKFTNQFKKDYKLAKRRGMKMELLNSAMEILANGKELPENYYDHSLSGNRVGYRECHIQPDWLLVYYFEDDVLVLTLVRTGSHSDLFK